MSELVRHHVGIISPDQARFLCGKFFAAGRIDRRLVDSYAQDMSRGHWMLNGNPIILDSEGAVLDGRTRLLACVKANVGFMTLIVEGVNSASFESIDAMRKRTLADVLHIRNEQNGRSLAAALRLIWLLRHGMIGKASPPSLMTLLNLLEEAPEIRDSLKPGVATAAILTPACGIALHYLFNLASPQTCRTFFAELCSEGDGQSPAKMLRKTLMDLKTKGGARKIDYLLALTIKAWNAQIQAKECKLLRYSPDREGFPTIAGLSLGWTDESPKVGADAESQAPVTLPDPGTIRVRVTMVTPEMADALLDRNPNNRTIALPVMEKYARDMKAGKWQLNGQTIKVGRSGRLLDGQHRLEACRAAEVAFPAVIVEGVDDDTFTSLDMGHRRGLAEVLSDYGESQSAVLASALRWLWMIENGVVLAADASPTNGELLDYLNNHPHIRNSLRAVNNLREFMGAGLAAALHYVCAERSAADADAFFEKLSSGLLFNNDSDPVWHLRERLRKSRESHRVRLAEAERMALTIKAWNAVRENRPVYQLSWRNRGTGREKLPLPI